RRRVGRGTWWVSVSLKKMELPGRRRLGQIWTRRGRTIPVGEQLFGEAQQALQLRTAHLHVTVDAVALGAQLERIDQGDGAQTEQRAQRSEIGVGERVDRRREASGVAASGRRVPVFLAQPQLRR